jgi:hypothetical protein
MYSPDQMGRDEGPNLGPEPGKGAVIHHASGEADFDGLSGDELPPRKNVEQNQPFPPEKSAD